MRIRLVAALAATLWVGMMATSRTSAAVDLELRTSAQSVSRFAPVDVTLYAVWDGVGDSEFTITGVILYWDPTILSLNGPAQDTGPHSWNFMFGFLYDAALDERLNADCGPDTYCVPFTKAPFNDGNAYFEALSFLPAATATIEGLELATFQFVALADSPSTDVTIESSFGNRFTRVLNASVDVMGELFGTTVAVQTDAVLIARDVMLPAGRIAEVIVFGEVLGQDIGGVEVLVEVIPRSGVEGVVEFTPELDIIQLDDPWPGINTFDTFDTDQSGSPLLNGSIEDNGTHLPTQLTFTGDLVAFPLVASIDARGTWELALLTPENDSLWLPSTIKTGLRHATLTIVELGDGDGSGLVDLRDDSEFQVCFTGDVGPVDPPAFSLDPDLRCGVYDFDDDGDVDGDDHAEFLTVMSGPTP